MSEVAFRDLRFPLLYVLLLALPVCAVLRLRAKNEVVEAPSGDRDTRAMTRFLVIFMVVSFVLWMKLFAVYRYVVVCEFLAPLTIYLVLGAILRSPRRQVRVALAAMAFLLVTLAPGHWGRRPWTSDYFDANLPALAGQRNSIVLVTGHDPIGYLIPHFPPETRFLRIQGYFTGPSTALNATDRLMMQAVAEHNGPLLILFRVYEEWNARKALEFYGLQPDCSSCQPFTPGVEPQQEHPFFLCRVTPLTSALKGKNP